MAEFIRFKEEDLIEYTISFMSRLGVPPEDGRIVGNVLVEADIRGVDSHGLIRLSSYYGSRLRKKYMDPCTPLKTVKETDLQKSNKKKRAKMPAFLLLNSCF